MAPAQNKITPQTGKTKQTQKSKTGTSGKSSTSGSNSGSSKTKTGSNNSRSGALKKETIYTFGPYETLFYDEISSNFRANGHRFAIVTQDRRDGKLTLVIDGKKIVTADEIQSPALGFGDSSDIIYAYRNGNEWNVVINNSSAGPYEEVGWYYPYMARSYSFKRMGNVYFRAADGTITTSGKESVWSAPGDATFTSSRGNVVLKFEDGNRTMNYQGNRFRTVPEGSQNVEVYEVYLSDKGDGVFVMDYKLDDRWEKACYRVDNGRLFKCEVENFDNYVRTLLDRDGITPTRSFEHAQNHIGEIGSWVNDGLNLTLKDQKGSHLFTSAWNYDYVMVDDTSIPCTPPFFAFYDSNSDKFAWISHEGNSLVMYTFKL